MERELRLEDFPLRSMDKLRYGDTDRQGHVNNAVFSTLLETGRVEMIYDGKDSFNDPDCSFVIVHLSLDYVRELRWPGRVDIGTRVQSIGRSSIRMEQAVFQDGRLAAQGETVIVQTNEKTRKSQALSPRLIERLQAFVVQ
jgi:acyl-CoA thioester hydrolase